MDPPVQRLVEAAVTAAEQRQAEAQAAQLDAEALALERHVETEVHADYERGQAQIEAGVEVVRAALTTRDIEAS